MPPARKSNSEDLSQVTDEGLVEKYLRDHNLPALKELGERYRQIIFDWIDSWARATRLKRAEVADAANCALFALLHVIVKKGRPGRFAKPHSVRTLARCCARRRFHDCCRTLWRTERRWQKRDVESALDDAPIRPWRAGPLSLPFDKRLRAPAWEVEYLEELECFEARLAELTPDDRKICELVVDGKSQQEIADELQTTRHHVRMGLEHIRAKLGPWKPWHP